MYKIVLFIITIFIVCLALFLWFKLPKNKLENPLINQNLGKILGFSKDTPVEENDNNLFTQTKDSFEKNTQKNIESVKDLVYNEAKTTLDNVFDKQVSNDKNTNEVTVNILGVTNTNNEPSYVIDFTSDHDLKLNLTVNNKYYLKFQNLPANFCIYINNNKYPISNGVIEIQFGKGGNYPIKANSCDLNEKNIGILNVQ